MRIPSVCWSTIMGVMMLSNIGSASLPAVSSGDVLFEIGAGKPDLSRFHMYSPSKWTADDVGIVYRTEDWGWDCATVNVGTNDYRLDADVSVQLDPAKGPELVNPKHENGPGFMIRQSGDRAVVFYLNQPWGGWAAQARYLPYGSKFPGKQAIYGFSREDTLGWHHITALVKGKLANFYVDNVLTLVMDLDGYDGGEAGLTGLYGGRFKNFRISKLPAGVEPAANRAVRSYLDNGKVYKSKYTWQECAKSAGAALDKAIADGTTGVPGYETMPTFTYRCVTWMTPDVSPFYAYPAFHHSQMMDTMLKYYDYTRDRKYLVQAFRLADWELDHSTPATDALPHLPYSTVFNGTMGGNMDGECVMLDKAGITGQTYLRLWKLSHKQEYLDGAKLIAETLLKMQQPEGRWQNRVEHKTGKVVQDYTSNQVFIIRLMDALYAATDDVRYRDSSKRALDWVLANPVKDWRWTGFYEDLGPKDESIGHWEAIETAQYLLAHREGHPEYVKIAKDIADWISTGFAVKEKGRWPMICEQSDCMPAMAGHSLHVAPLLVDLWKATGDTYYRDSAISATNAGLDCLQSGDDAAIAWYNGVFAPIWLGIGLARDLGL